MAMIGEILVEKGYVTQQQIDGVMSVKGEGAQVGQVLICLLYTSDAADE